MTSAQTPESPVPPAVFVADDSAVVRFAVARELRAAGLEVVEQASADPPAAGVAARVKCALLDLDLGNGSGCDVAEALRAERAELPVAFFSATVAEASLARARAMGPVFAKPAEMADAIAWVVARAKG